MKKIITLLAVLISFIASAQNYTFIAQRYDWIAGHFREGFGFPYGTTPTIFTGQVSDPGQAFYNTTDSTLYIWTGTQFLAIGGASSTFANNGLLKTSDTIGLGGPLSSPAPLLMNRRIDLNNNALYITKGDFTPDTTAFDERFTPLYYHIIDSTISDPLIYTPTIPKSGGNWTREMRITDGNLRAKNRYGWRHGMHYVIGDSGIIQTDGLDYGQAAISDLRFMKRLGHTGRSGLRVGFGTNANNRVNEAVASHVANIFFQGTTASDYIVVDGYVTGYAPYLVMANGAPDSLKKGIVYYGQNSFMTSPSWAQNSYVLRPSVYWNRVDSAFLIFDTARAATSGKSIYNFWRAKTRIGANGTDWTTPYQFHVDGASYFEDSVTLATATNTADTTGYDITLRRRSDGTLTRISGPDLATFLGGSSGTGGSGNITFVTTTPYTVLPSDFYIITNLGAGTITMPDPALFPDREIVINAQDFAGSPSSSLSLSRYVYIENDGSSDDSVNTHSRYTTAIYKSDGSKWIKVSGSYISYPGSRSSGGTSLINSTNSITQLKAGLITINSLKGLKPGTGISLSNDSNDITITATGSGAAWGSITGTLSDQTDLQDSLNAKLDSLTTMPAHIGETPSGKGIIGAEMFVKLSSDFDLEEVDTDQNAFSTSLDSWTLQSNTTYNIKGYYKIGKSATSLTIAIGFGGTATFNSIDLNSRSFLLAAVNTGTSTSFNNQIEQATATVVTTASTTANSYINFEGSISVNSGGTFIPQIKFSTTPGSATIMKAGSRISITPVGNGTIETIGNVN